MLENIFGIIGLWKFMLASVLTGLYVACSILVAPVVGATGGNTLSTEYYCRLTMRGARC